MSGFFVVATEGHTFAPLSLVKQKFGRTLEVNYPEAGPAFLAFARSYWTLKLVTDHADYSPSSLTGHQLLALLEQNVASVFFPTPGPIKIDPDQRETTQRELISRFAPGIEIEDFIERNPILLRDRGDSGRSCASGVLLLLGRSVALAYLAATVAA